MAVGALLAGYYQGAYFAMGQGMDTGEAGSGFSKVAAEKVQGIEGSQDDREGAVTSRKGTGASVPYTRQITAKIRLEKMTAGLNGAGEMVYSYESSTQEFSMFINNDGQRKTYTVRGTDENGNAFEREIDPYEVDPKNADYTEFSALCLYVQQTDDTADMLANEYFSPGDIFERKDYFSMLGVFSADDDGMFSAMGDMFRTAGTIFDKLQELMDKQMELIDLLFDKTYSEKKLALEDRAEDNAASVSDSEGAEEAERVKPDYMPYAGERILKNRNEYFRLAEGDTVVYEGVAFVCDRLTDTLTLGDVSNPDNCIRVGLSNGGSLLFNRDDTGSLMNAIDMFSPEDQDKIMKAIQLDNMTKKAEQEAEDSLEEAMRA